MDSQKRTGKRSGEIVENTYLWKKRTGNEPKTKRAMLKFKTAKSLVENKPHQGWASTWTTSPLLRLLDRRKIG